MDIYRFIKLSFLIKSPRLKFLGLFILHITKQRYLALHFDPVNACNLRCKMCYFSDKDYVKKLKGVFPVDVLDYFGNAFFKRAIKLQIGCGTEPTLYKNIDKIIEKASQAKVPHISMVTNGLLLEKEKVKKWIVNGLSEIILSLHGVEKETYETMMSRGNFKRFLEVLQFISVLKQGHTFKFRINYTFNQDNFKELRLFYSRFGKFKPDYLQIRPIINMGNTEYKNFSFLNILPIYNEVYYQLIRESKKHGVKLLMHSIKQLESRKSIHSIINMCIVIFLQLNNLMIAFYGRMSPIMSTLKGFVWVGKF